MRGEFELRLAAPGDGPEIVALVVAEGLPAPHRDRPGASFFVARSAGALEGCVGLEPHGDAQLLRSVAVAPSARSIGLGRALVERALEVARARGAREVVLLTLDAAPFFEHLGFARCERGDVDAALLDSWEFRHHACDEALVLRCAL